MHKIMEHLINNLDQAILLFDNGELSYSNLCTKELLDSLQVQEMFFSLDELEKLLDLPPMQGNASESRTIYRNQHTVTITRNQICEGWVQFAMRDMTNEIQQAKKFEALTTELLVQVRSKITNAQNAIVLYRDYRDTLSDAECTTLSAGACFELWQLERTLDNIRDINSIRIHTADTAFDIIPCDVTPLIHKAIETISKVRPDPSRKMEVAVDTNGKSTVLADPKRLIRILETMILNAHLYSDEGSPIHISIHEEPTQIHISVENSGPDIHIDDVPHIFIHGFRGRNALSLPFSGNGFDLCYSLNLAMRMQGRMEFDSGSGTTTFRLDLPNANDRHG